MEKIISIRILKNAELLLRITMTITLLVAGISKFCSRGGFYTYYSKQFQNPDLRINMPSGLIDLYLALIPYIETGIALALISSFKRRWFVVTWIIYFISLEIGHYILEEFTSADLLIPIILFGVVTYILPCHEPPWAKKKTEKN